MRTLSIPGHRVLLWCLALWLPGCITPYTPDAISMAKSYLVVDGFINSNGVTTISLTRTYDIHVSTAPPRETKATVYIEQESGPRYMLREVANGTYTSDKQVLSTEKRYRLHLTTAAGKEYASDFVTAKTTPAIDNLTWKAEGTGVSIFVNSHDNTNATRYYRWEYEETWLIKPLLVPDVEYFNRAIRPIAIPYPYVCWATQKSTAIKLNKTTSLTQDIVADYPLQTLSTTTSKLYHKYSILVKQYAQTKEEYAYWDLLKKNTENIGTLFDPLPAQLTGNVHCLSDNTEIALGYLGVYSVAEKRIFISRAELPTTWRLVTGYENCIPPDTIPATETIVFYGINPPIVPVTTVYFRQNGNIRGYTSSSADCVDCRKRGTAIKPDFWP